MSHPQEKYPMPLMPLSQTQTANAASKEGFESWRKAVRSSQRQQVAELADVPAFIELWGKTYLDREVSAEDLARMAVAAGVLGYTLRRSNLFKVRCSRLAELLGRLVLVQPPEGIGGLRFARSVGLPRGWIIRRAEDADRAIIATREREIRAEREAAVQATRARRAARKKGAAVRSRGNVGRSR